jgi:hypothetical protein
VPLAQRISLAMRAGNGATASGQIALFEMEQARSREANTLANMSEPHDRRSR